jgi:cell division protein FtsQ
MWSGPVSRAVAARPGVRGRGRRPAARTRRRSASRSLVSVWLRRVVLGAILAALLAAGYLLWFRDSSLVEVREVRVEGLSGPEGQEIASALEAAGLEMTTLHVRLDELAAAVRGYPAVEALRVSSDFPHGLEITVTERRPVAVVSAGSDEVAVSGDGTLLPATVTDELDLPAVEAEPAEGAPRLDGSGVEQASVLGAAPEPLRSVIERAVVSPEGVEVRLDGAISLRFGDSSRAAEKWAAAARVLADPELQSLTYIDLRSPSRPAVGGAVPSGEVTEPLPPG